jgi:hypothetical protein
VADGASTCPNCGATIWQPGAVSRQVAVTPAPVALVLPVPSASPPALSLPPQRPAPAPTAPAPTVEAPPSTPATTPLPTPPPPARPTVVPTSASPQRKPNHFVVAIGTVVPLLAVVVLIIALPAHGAKPGRLPAVATDANAQFNLRALAAAEETTLTATKSYSTERAALDAAGYQPAPGKPVTISAGISESGYCLVASAGGPTSPWFLYDSQQGGLVSTAFTSANSAQQACADGAITSYVPVS